MQNKIFIPLWSDRERRLQLMRLRSARYHLSQMKQAKAAREAALAANAAASDGATPLGRVPRAVTFDAVLQVFALAERFGIKGLQLSLKEFAELADLSASSVKRVLKALKAIGWASAATRFGIAVIDGARKAIYRTALRGLSLIASKMLFLGNGSADANANTDAAANAGGDRSSGGASSDEERSASQRRRAEERGGGRRGKRKSKAARAKQAGRRQTAPRAAEQAAAVTQAEPQSAETVRSGLEEVARRNPFLMAWVERGLAAA